MATNEQTINNKIRSYILDQGKSIITLNQILNSNLFIHHLRKGISAFIELVLYLLFICFMLIIMFAPMDLSYYVVINDHSSLGLEYHNKNIQLLFICIKGLLVLSSLPLLFFAVLVGRNRKKNNLIRMAFEEVTKMKEKLEGMSKCFYL